MNVRSYRGRYRWLALSLVAFVAVGAGMLAYSLVLTEKITVDSTRLELVGRHQVLNERIQRTLLLFDKVDQTGVEMTAPVEQLRLAVRDFDDAIYGLLDGGVVTDSTGTSRDVVALADPDNLADLDEALSVWASIYGYLGPLVDKDGSVEPNSVGFTGSFKPALIYVQGATPDLEATMGSIQARIEARSQQHAEQLRLLQIAGMALAAAYALLAFIFLIRRLRQGDAEILRVMASLERILDFVPQGLFVIDRDLKVGDQTSSALHRLFPANARFDGTILDTMRPFVPPATLDLLRDYLDIMFDDNVIDDLVADLNPLDAVQFIIPSEDGTGPEAGSDRYLKFDFRRIYQNDEIRGLLISVTDVTRSVQLELEVERSSEQSERRMSLLMGVLHLEPEDLREFLSRTRAGLLEINEIFKDELTEDNRQRLQAAMPRMHRIKGDAAAMGIESFAERAHAFEDELATLQRTPDLDGKQMLALVMEIRSMLDDGNEIDQIIGRLAGAARTAPAPRAESDSRFGLHRVAAEVSAARGREVSVLYDNSLDRLDLPADQTDHLRSALVQLVRNACAHGIEAASARAKRGKSRAGRILVGSESSSAGVLWYVEDDGAGIDYEAIRAKAVEAGLIGAQSAGKMTHKQLIGLLFKPGFSTSDQVDLGAGRGVGLEVVATAARALGAKLGVKSRVGQSTRFEILLPAATMPESMQGQAA